jgi:predicted MFS family arabinose efflux permease
VSYLVSLVCVLTVRSSLQDSPAEPPTRRLRAELFDGVRWIWGHRFLRALLLWFTGMGVVFNSIGLVTLVLAREHGASASELGVMFAIVSAGGLAGALAAPWVLRNLPRHRLVTLFSWIILTTTLLLLVADSPYVIGVLGAVAFVLVPSLSALAFSIIAEQAPDRLQGRAVSAGIQIASLAAPLGPLLAGVLLGALGTNTAILVYSVALVALTLVASASSALRLPDPPRELATGVRE